MMTSRVVMTKRASPCRPDRVTFRKHCKHLTTGAIASLYGVKVGTVYAWRRFYKIIDHRTHGRKITDSEVERMRQMQDDGSRPIDIIKKFPISMSYGYHILAYTKR